MSFRNARPTALLLGTMLALSAPVSAFAQSANEAFRLGVDAFESENYERAAQLWEPLARAGEVEAMRNLAQLYRLGLGVEKDPRRAFTLYRAAAERGLAEAQVGTAFLLLSGEGTEKDVGKAALWFARAADQGDPLAQFNLGLMYERGVGVDRDLGLSAELYALAAEQGQTRAQTRLEAVEQLQLAEVKGTDDTARSQDTASKSDEADANQRTRETANAEAEGNSADVPAPAKRPDNAKGAERADTETAKANSKAQGAKPDAEKSQQAAAKDAQSGGSEQSDVDVAAAGPRTDSTSIRGSREAAQDARENAAAKDSEAEEMRSSRTSAGEKADEKTAAAPKGTRIESAAKDGARTANAEAGAPDVDRTPILEMKRSAATPKPAATKAASAKQAEEPRAAAKDAKTAENMASNTRTDGEADARADAKSEKDKPAADAEKRGASGWGIADVNKAQSAEGTAKADQPASAPVPQRKLAIYKGPAQTNTPKAAPKPTPAPQAQAQGASFDVPSTRAGRVSQFKTALAAIETKDYAAAVAGLKPLADANIPGAQFWLGRLYYRGTGVQKNYFEAYSLWRAAATAGSPHAATALVNLQGRLSPAEREQAARYHAAWRDAR